jgi:tetratricopeptide (TPR) repeat protein
LADSLLIGVPSHEYLPQARIAAATLIDKALELDPLLGEAWVTRAQLDYDQAQAEEFLRRGLELNPNYARGWELLADTVAQQPGRAQEALELIDRARALDPLLPRSDHVKAFILAEQFGDFEGAEALWWKVLSVDPNFRSALFGLGSLNVYTGDYAEAVALYERALAIDPQADFVRSMLLTLYLGLGDLAAAQAIDPPSDKAGGWNTLKAQGDWAAIAARLSALDPQARRSVDPELLAEAALRKPSALGGAASARAILAAALGYTGTLPEGLYYFNIAPYLALAQLMQSADDGDAARNLLHDLLSRLDAEQLRAAGVPRNVDTPRALVLAHLGEIDSAIAMLERATTPAPSAWVMPLQRDHPLFAPLAAEPRFQAIMDRVEAHTAQQRKLLEQMRSRGEIPSRGAS